MMWPFFWSHCTACGILVPQPGIEPVPPAVEGQVPTTGQPGIPSAPFKTKNYLVQNVYNRTSLVAQWLGLCAPNTGGQGSIPGQGTRSHTHAAARSLHAETGEPTCHN